jgi:hypothetical protein
MSVLLPVKLLFVIFAGRILLVILSGRILLLVVTTWFAQQENHNFEGLKRFSIRLLTDAVYRLAMGWTTEKSEFKSLQGQEFSSPCRPDQLWGSPSFQSNAYCGFFRQGKMNGALS